jgi:hypothetical protein
LVINHLTPSKRREAAGALNYGEGMHGLASSFAGIRRGLAHPVSVQALIEFAMWITVPYLMFGFAWAVIHPDNVQALQTQWTNVVPAGADLAAFGEAAALWPAILLLPTTCTAPGQ